jgi:transglutaminase-like putative cysteine protease
MAKPLFNLLILTFFSTFASAQNFAFGDYSKKDMEMKRYDADTSAHAVVLNEYGTSGIRVMSDDNIKIVFEYHVKIKILDSKGFDKGTIQIPFYSAGSDTWEEVDDIKGITTYNDDNGNIKTAELDPSKIVSVKENKYWSYKKFAMPNLRSGAIIEYSYRLATPFWDKFQPWHFQDDIPKITSTYEVHIPAFWSYNVLLRGNLKLTKNTSKLETSCFSRHGATCDCSNIVYGMENIPAFVEEDYMTSPKNFLSAIYFNLSEYTNLTTGSKVKVTKEWKDIDYNLKHADYFGSQLKRKDLLKQYISSVIAGQPTELDKAKVVYAYIQKNIKWNGFNARGSDDGIRKALDNHTGNVADVNLALVTALNSAGINAEAVLLSTRTNGIINKLYPVENEFNYVIARATINGTSYLLDATDPLLSFGLLPLKCLNDQGRVMSLDKPSYWIDLVAEHKKNSTSSLDLTVQNDGKIKGTITTYSAGYQAYEKRKAIKKFNTFDEYVENLDERLGKIKILKSEIHNLDSLDLQLSETYEIEINAFDNLNHTRLAFNPFIFDRLSTNPFKLDERNYPVDWGMPSDSRVILTMHLPENYAIENPPQGLAISLPNTGGKFITTFNVEGNDFTFSNMIQFSKSIYAPEEYPYLKEFYNKMISAEKVEIVFKKKS